jgi:hypothetical protein
MCQNSKKCLIQVSLQALPRWNQSKYSLKTEANKWYEFYQVEPPFGEMEVVETIDRHYPLEVAPDTAH